MKKDDRVWHHIFLWGTVLLTSKEKTTVLFDFKEVSYYKIGEGYHTYKNGSSAGNMITMPTERLHHKEIPRDEWTDEMSLQSLALNATIKL